MSNPRVPDTTNGGVVEESASDEDVNDFLRVEWTTSFARLERWVKEVELLQEEMRRVVSFLEWRSTEWLRKTDARKGASTPDVQSGLNVYAKKQAAIFHNLATTFVTLWHPTLVSYGLQHLWVTEYTKKHGVSLADTDVPTPQGRGIFKFRISEKSRTVPDPSNSSAAKVTTPHPLLEEADYSDNSSSEDCSGSEVDWYDNPDL